MPAPVSGCDNGPVSNDNADLVLWQKVLLRLKLWRPPHRTKHHEALRAERPTPPPVTGAHGNRVDLRARTRSVPQSRD